MDIVLLGSKSLKLKGKRSTIVVNPTAQLQKTEAEAILLLDNYEDQSFSKIEGQRIVIDGPGEYEVSGIKISATKANGGIVYLADIDNVKVLIGQGNSIERIYDKVGNCNIVVVDSDKEFDYGILPKIEPSVILIYGEKKEEVGKSLGKVDVPKISKFSVSAEKLPEDLQVLLLG